MGWDRITGAFPAHFKIQGVNYERIVKLGIFERAREKMVSVFRLADCDRVPLAHYSECH